MVNAAAPEIITLPPTPLYRLELITLEVMVAVVPLPLMVMPPPLLVSVTVLNESVPAGLKAERVIAPRLTVIALPAPMFSPPLPDAVILIEPKVDGNAPAFIATPVPMAMLEVWDVADKLKFVPFMVVLLPMVRPVAPPALMVTPVLALTEPLTETSPVPMMLIRDVELETEPFAKVMFLPEIIVGKLEFKAAPVRFIEP